MATVNATPPAASEPGISDLRGRIEARGTPEDRAGRSWQPRARAACRSSRRRARRHFESRRAHQSIRRRRISENAGRLKPPKRIGIAGRRAQLEPQASGHREVGDDLRGLPEMEHDGIRHIRGWRHVGGRGGQPISHSSQVALHRHRPLCKHRAIDQAHGFNPASTSSYPHCNTNSASHQNCAASRLNRSASRGRASNTIRPSRAAP